MDNIKRAFREKDVRGLARLALFRGRKLVKAVEPPERLFTFDSGKSISLPEAGHHLLILGGTGRGKTAGLVTPMFWQLVEQGLGGLVLDVKNTFGDAVRLIAADCGREKDVIEIGSLPSATPVNLLAGMSYEQIALELESMLLNGLEHTLNVDWQHKGIRLTLDCLRLLHFLDELLPGAGYTPSLALLSRMLDDLGYARSIWKTFLNAADLSRQDHQDFLQKVGSDHFHILRSHSPEKMTSKGLLDYDQQVTWQISNARKALQPFREDHLTPLSHGEALDLGRLVIDEGKIVLLRFSALTGGPGKTLAKMVKERLYAAVFSRPERSTGDNAPIFAVLDEFQDFLSLDETSSFDDLSWFSRSREFRVVNIVATQGLSSLYRRGLGHRVNALISQFATKIILQNDDPATDSWLRNFFEAPKPAQKLGAGEVILVKYSLPSRCQEVTMESFQGTHDRIQDRLTSLPRPAPVHFSPQIGLPRYPTGHRTEPATSEGPRTRPKWARTSKLSGAWETGHFTEDSAVYLPQGPISVGHREILSRLFTAARKADVKITLLRLVGPEIKLRTRPRNVSFETDFGLLCPICGRDKRNSESNHSYCLNCMKSLNLIPDEAAELALLFDMKPHRLLEIRGLLPELLATGKRIQSVWPHVSFTQITGQLAVDPMSIPPKRFPRIEKLLHEYNMRVMKLCPRCGSAKKQADYLCARCRKPRTEKQDMGF